MRTNWTRILGVAALCALGASTALAGNGKGRGNQVWSLVSDTSVLATPGDDYSGIFVPGNKLPQMYFGDITSLSTKYFVETGDCGGGAPRFEIALDTDDDGLSNGNVFVNIGPLPNFTGCTVQTWESTGNLVTDPALRWDLTKFAGPFYGSHADALALVGDATVVDVSLVVDGGWILPGQRQVIYVDDAKVNRFKLTVGFGGATQVKVK